MVEIVFSESAWGSLKEAQHAGEGDFNACGVGVIRCPDGSKPGKKTQRAALRQAQEAARKSWESAVPLGGDAGDAYGFNLALSTGPILEDTPGEERLQTLEMLFAPYPGGLGRTAAQEMIASATDVLAAVHRRLLTGEAARIWYSTQPDELCGLHWFMAVLESWHAPSPIFLVRLPEWAQGEDGAVVFKNGWGEVSPEEWHRYLPFQQEAPKAFRLGCAARWQELKQENAPLRAVLNGRLVSVPEDLYDPFILREICLETGEFHEAVLIGRVLGKYQLGISDGWLAHRIDTFVQSGLLTVTKQAEKGEPSYRRKLKKT